MITSWDDVFKYSWITPDGVAFFPYEKNGWLYYYFQDNPSRHTKWLLLNLNNWQYFNSYNRGIPNPMYQLFVGPMPLAVSPVILKIRQMEQRRKHACRI